MWVYWTLFFWPALSALGIVQSRATDLVGKLSISALAIALTLVIGLRFEVGVDWDNYLEHLYLADSLNLLDVLQGSDPAYGLLDWLAAGAGYGIWFCNLISAIVFVSGLLVFCNRLPNTWLALTVAMPYIVIVMAMNYTRQGAAFGLVLWGLVALLDMNVRRFLVLVLLATLFHKTAALLLPLAIFFVKGSGRLRAIIGVSIATTLAYVLFLSEHEVVMYETYILDRYTSDGAAIRVIMNTAAAVVFLLARVRINIPPEEKMFWTRFSLISLLFVPALLLSPSSTAVDRMALYFLPLQLVAYAHIPDVVARWGLKKVMVIFLVAFYWLVMFVWFNYSNFHHAWLPYKFYPFEVS